MIAIPRLNIPEEKVPPVCLVAEIYLPGSALLGEGL
jgi:hypothetical protein